MTMGARIQSPLSGYSQTTRIGDVEMEFKDGVAVVDHDLSDGHILYLKSRGYKVTKTKAKGEDEAPEPLPADVQSLPGDGIPLDEVPDGVEDAADQDGNGISDEQEGMEVDEDDNMPQTPKARPRKSRKR